MKLSWCYKPDLYAFMFPATTCIIQFWMELGGLWSPFQPNPFWYPMKAVAQLCVSTLQGGWGQVFHQRLVQWKSHTEGEVLLQEVTNSSLKIALRRTGIFWSFLVKALCFILIPQCAQTSFRSPISLSAENQRWMWYCECPCCLLSYFHP